MRPDNRNIPQLSLPYPDVLGMVTQSPRINMDALECAVGIYPQVAYINQPIEVVIVLQNLIDEPLQLKVAIRLPTADRKGNVVILESAKSQIAMTLNAGEVGVLRMPIIALPPTQPVKDLPVRVAIRYRSKPGSEVRPPGGGAPPSVLTASPFKLQVLRDIEFVAHKWNESTDIITVYFDLAPRNIPGEPPALKVSYDVLWTQEEMDKETRLARAHYEEALELAQPAPTANLYLAFLDEVEERFAAHGMPLHPGETMAIAKMLTYTVEDAPSREPDYVLEDKRWFRSLCQVLASDQSLLERERNEIIAHHCFEGVIYEAILLAFTILGHHVEEDLGDRAEQLNYANRFLRWFSGYGEGDLTYVYLPLVLGGVVNGLSVRGGREENPWDLVDELTEAYKGRSRLVTDEAVVIFQMMFDLLAEYQAKLRYQRIQRPDR